MDMQRRSLGPFEVAAIGLGCMNVSHGYTAPTPKPDAQALLLRALSLGVDHFDTAAFYGAGRNEALVGETLKPFRQDITLASKGGMTIIDGSRVIDSRPASLVRDCEASLRRLQTEVIDLYYLHRWEKSVPIEDCVGAMADLLRAGKIRAIGLSEVSAATLRRAHAIHPIAAVQSEYSLWTRTVELKVSAACRSLGIALVAFSPLGRGFLTSRDVDPAAFRPGDIRVSMPRFLPPHFARNQALLQQFRALAARWRLSPAALSLAWLLHRGDHVLPIPGTTSILHLEENLHAAALRLDALQIAELDALINPETVSGDRYPQQTMGEVDTETL